MNQLPPPTATLATAVSLVLTRCTSRGSNPDQRILSPPLSPLKVLVPTIPPSPTSWLGGTLSHLAPRVSRPLRLIPVV